MTNNNYTQMSNSELLDEIIQTNINYNYIVSVLRKTNPELIQAVLDRTSFLLEYYKDKTPPFVARLYCLEHNIDKSPICENPTCNNPIGWDKSRKRFKQHCCVKCVHSDPKYIQNREQYFISTIGVPYPLMSDEIRLKTNESTILNYGGLGFASNDISQKIRDTNKAIHGDEIIYNTEYWRNRCVQGCQAKFNSDNSLMNKTIRDKCRNSCIKNNGVPYPFMSSDILQKTFISIRKIYGGMGGKSSQILSKIQETNNNRYGYDWFTQTKDYQETKKHKYHSEKYPGLTFDSTWEVKVYEFCMDNSIEVEYSPSVVFKYEYDGKVHTYHPDFLINGKLYEVKGDYFFRINESTGKEEMFCPYRYDDWSDEYYEWMCGKFEAKHQCMKKNNVLILRDKDIRKLSINMFMINSLI